jgi:hypothetical protein
MNFKTTSIALCALFSSIALQAVVGSLPGSVKLVANQNGTISASVARGKNFTVPSLAQVNLVPFCLVAPGVSTVWQAIVSVPITFTCPCAATPIVTTGLETNNILTHGPIIIDATFGVVSNVSTTGFVFNAILTATACDNAPISEAEIFAILVGLGTTFVNFNASCVK